MRVAFRFDAGPTIGLGHSSRCSALAAELAFAGNRITTIVRTGDEPGWSWERDADETIAAIGPTWDWLVVDHQLLAAPWHQRLRAVARRILVIDDLADRDYDCDLLLDQNLHVDAESRYAARIPPHCRLLTGPRHALLRREFAAARARMKPRDGSVRRLHVGFGGSDPTAETEKALVALSDPRFHGLAIDVVVGPANRRRAAIAAACLPLGARCHVDPPDLAALMLTADLAIGAGGVSTWERCALGLPALVIAVAANQEAPSQSAATAGAQIYLGRSADLTPAALATALASALADPAQLRALSTTAAGLTDAQGTRTIADELARGG